MNRLYFRLEALSKAGGIFPEPVVNLVWNYGEKGPDGEIKYTISIASRRS